MSIGVLALKTTQKILPPGSPNDWEILEDNTETQPFKSFECLVDAEFAGNWLEEGAVKDPMTMKSQYDWVITYAGCLITWSSKLQMLTALSTTEAMCPCHQHYVTRFL